MQAGKIVGHRSTRLTSPASRSQRLWQSAALSAQTAYNYSLPNPPPIVNELLSLDYP
jgi:hypothetical protein